MAPFQAWSDVQKMGAPIHGVISERTLLPFRRYGLMATTTQRISTGAQLGIAKRGVDLALGSAALIPILLIGLAVWIVPQTTGVSLAILAVMWSGALLTFFAGVRRGLSFSEKGGARVSELTTMLCLFSLGMLTLIFESPLIGMIGFASLAVLDSLAARRLQAPSYFQKFRPVQMLAAMLGLTLILAREV